MIQEISIEFKMASSSTFVLVSMTYFFITLKYPYKLSFSGWLKHLMVKNKRILIRKKTL